jgi:hypothetical protein
MNNRSKLGRYTVIIGCSIAALVIFFLLISDANERPKKNTVVDGVSVEEGAENKL